MERSMHTSRISGRTAGPALCRLALAVAATAVIAACGTIPADQNGGAGNSGGTGPGSPAAHAGSANSPGSGRSAGSASQSTGPSGAAAANCPPSAIRVTLDIQASGVAAGSSYVPVDFTNISGTACQLAGYPVVTLASQAGKQIGTGGTADRSLAAERVLLATGQVAHIWLHLLDVVNIPSTRCGPATAAGLRIWLPGFAAATFLSHPMTTCSKQVKGIEIMTVEPFRPGHAQPGTAQ
jgi:hypothetical protein